MTEDQNVTELKLAELEKQHFKKTFTVGNDTYVYCFDEMSITRIFQGETLFRIWLAIQKNLPKLPSEVQTVVERRTLQHAYAAMLMKKTPHGYEKYNPATVSSFDVMDDLTGKDYDTFLECKADFFLSTGLSLEVSTAQSEQQMKDAVAMLKEMSPEQLASISPLIQSAIQTQLSTNKGGDTITIESINSNLESHLPGM